MAIHPCSLHAAFSPRFSQIGPRPMPAIASTFEQTTRNNMAKTDFKTVDQYHAAFPPDTVERLETIRGIIQQVAPKAEEVISYQIPAYKQDGWLIYYSAYKSHITLSYPWTAAFLAHFKQELAGYKMSKSAIQLPHNEPLPQSLIKKIVQFRLKENKALAQVKPAVKAKPAAKAKPATKAKPTAKDKSTAKAKPASKVKPTAKAI